MMRNAVRRELEVIARCSRLAMGIAELSPDVRFEEMARELDDRLAKEGLRRVYQETVIIDDDRILIGVPTGHCDLVPVRAPAG